MNQIDFQSILDQCIKRIQEGEALARCLADYPEMAEELRPLLTLSADLIDLEPLAPSAQGVQRGRDLMFAAFDQEDEQEQAALGLIGFLSKQWDQFRSNLAGWFGPAQQLGFVGRLAVVLIGLIASGGLITNASADSSPSACSF